MEHSTTAIPDAPFANDTPSGSLPEQSRLGRYRLRREIGRGFSSVVFEATDLQRQRAVALKVLTFLQNLSPERRGDLSERFAREARAISALSHPNIVAIYEVGQAEDGRQFIAMEMLDGETLRARLQRDGTLPPAEAVMIALQLADALHFAHERGIVHRDVKPDNVFVLPDGRIKLMDFGVAHVLSDEALTQTGTVVGSPAYMSPEQINGEHLDGRSDVFSLGVVLAEMVVGHKPFEAPTIPAVMHRILNRPPQMEAISPRPLRKIIEKALSKSRMTRLQSAAAFADVLRRQVLPELPLWEPTSTVVMPTPCFPLPAGRDAVTREGSSAPRRPASRAARWGLVASGAMLAAALSLGGFHSFAHPTARTGVHLSQTLTPITPATAGVLHRIPAYWRRGPVAAQRISRPRWAIKPAMSFHSTLQPAPSVRIVENEPAARGGSLSPSPLPGAKTHPLVLKALRPAIAVSPRKGFFLQPRSRPLVVRVAGVQQEQTLAAPAGADDRAPSPADQDVEQIAPADPRPASPDVPAGPASADSVPDSPPHLFRRTPTLYPRSVPEEALGGAVTLHVFTDEEGNVSRADVVRSSGIPDLDDAAVETVKSWEYVPAFRGGQPVSGEARARIRFPK